MHWLTRSPVVLGGDMFRSPARYLLYSHDTYGLGHLRRTTLIAQAIVARSPHANVLIATGSPRAQSFSLPARVDALILPAVTKDNRGAYVPRKFTTDIDALVKLRSDILLGACTGFEPDVILIDQSPIGMGGELVAALDHAAHLTPSTHVTHRPRIVLGLRDIVDDARRVDADWTKAGVWGRLGAYDDVLVYGDDRILTTATELGLTERLRAAVTHVGFVAPPMEPNSIAAAGSDPFLLVTPGGGGDGQTMVRRFLDAVDAGATGGLRSVIVTGPLMSSDRRDEVAARAAQMSHVDVVEFVDDMRHRISSAVGVISMAGYNTVVETLAAGTPTLLVPRTEPRLEQDIRAERLAVHPLFERCPADALSAQRVADFVERARRCPSPPACAGGAAPLFDLDIGGASRAAAILTAPRVVPVPERLRSAARPELAHV